MATRIYLSSTASMPAGVSNPTVSTWTETTGFVRRGASTSRGSSAMTNKTQGSHNTGANATWLDTMYVMGPLAGQTFGISTVKGTIRALESAVNDNIDAMRLVVRVVAPDGTTFRGTIYGPANSTVAEFNTSLRAKRLATGGATTSVTITEGDYLVIEIGATATTGGTSISTSINYGDNSATDLGDNETDTTANNPFIEFAANMKLLQQGYGQAQARIKAIDVEGFGQAQTYIPTPYVKAVLADNPTGYWRLDETTGIIAYDGKGGFNGSYIATPTLGVTGALTHETDTAVTFDGSTEYVSVTDAVGIQPGNGNWSYELWFKCRVVPDTSKIQRLLMKGNVGNASPMLFLDNTVAGRLTSYSEGWGAGAHSSVNITDTNWHHVIFTKTAAHAWFIYLDGIDVTVSDAASQTGPAAAGNLEFGRSTDNSKYFDGSLDEVAFYLGTALTASQAKAHYDAAVNAWGSGQAQCFVQTNHYGLGQAQTDIKAQGYGLGQALTLIPNWFRGQANALITTSPVYTTVLDTFTRTVSDDIGTSDNAGTWSFIAGTTANADVNGSVLTVINKNSELQIWSLKNTLISKSIEISANISIDKLPTTALQSFYILSHQASSNDIVSIGQGIIARISISSSGNFSLSLTHNAFGASTTIGSYIAGTTFGIKGQMLHGFGKVVIKLKIWDASGSEPEPWTLIDTSTTVHEEGFLPGHVMLMAESAQNDANGPFTWTLDNIKIINAYLTGHGQAQAKIVSGTYGSGQAQADIKTQGYGLGQAQSDTKAQGNGLGQAQANIRKVINAFGQAQTYVVIDAYSDSVISDGAFFYLRLADTNATAIDERNVSNGTYSGGYTQSVGGVVPGNNSASFDGIDGQIQFPDNANFASIGSTYTIEFWARRLDAATGYQLIYTKNSGGNVFFLNNKLTLDNTSVTIAESTGTITDPHWHQYIITRNGVGTGNTKFYQDDVLIAITEVNPNAANASSGFPGYIAAYSSAGLNFNGAVDEVAVYGTPLSATQVHTHFNNVPHYMAGQAQAQIKVTYFGLGQAQADIKAIGYGLGQAQTDVKAKGYGLGQAQADIKTQGYGFGQAQCDVKAKGYGLGQAQCDVKAKGYGLGQAQGDVKTQGYGLGQAQCDVKAQGYGLGQAQCDVKAKGFGLGQAQCDVKAKGFGLGQAQCDVKTQGYGLGQAQCDVKTQGYGFGQAQADIKTQGYGLGQANAVIDTGIYSLIDTFTRTIGANDGWGTADSGTDWTNSPDGYSVDGSHGVFDTNTEATSQRQPRVTTREISLNVQFKTSNGFTFYWNVISNFLNDTYFAINSSGTNLAALLVEGGSTIDLNNPYLTDYNSSIFYQIELECFFTSSTTKTLRYRIYPVGGDIPDWYLVTDYVTTAERVGGFAAGGALGDGSLTYIDNINVQKFVPYGNGQAQANIKTQGFGLGQAQADIKTQGFGLGQAQCDVKAKGFGLGQAQADIKAVGFGLGQANADIKAQGYGFGQANASILGAVQQYGQAQADIKTQSYGFGQAQSDIKTQNRGFAQAQSDVKAQGYGLGQANCDIKTQGYGLGQAQADIKAKNWGWGQSQADIKSNQWGSGQVLCFINGTYTSASDAFTRSVATGWGTADVGGPWTSSDDVKFSVNGTQGIINDVAQNIHLDQVLNTKNFEIRLTWSLPVAGSIFNVAYLGSSNPPLIGSYDSTTDGGVTVSGLGAVTVSQDIGFSSNSAGAGTYVFGDQWILKYRVIIINSTNQIIGTVKTWKVGTPEPAWQSTRTVINSKVKRGHVAIIRGTGPTDNLTVDDYNLEEAWLVGWGQAQADILTQSYGFGQAQTDILTQNYGFGQAQCDIKVTTNQCAQAQTDIKTQGYGSGQAQAKIETVTTTNRAYGQAQTWVVIDAYSDSVISDRAFAYWRLADTNATAIEERGLATGFYGGGYTQSTGGVVPGNSSVDFDGSSGYIEFPDGAEFASIGNFYTIEAWIRRDDSATGYQVFYAKNSGGNFYFQNNQLVLDNTSVEIVRTVGTITDPHWHYVVATRNGTGTGNTKIYIDDVEVSITEPNPNAVNASSGASGKIGSYGPSPSLFFNGGIDEVAIYDYALSATQIHTHFNNVPHYMAGQAQANIKVIQNGSGQAQCTIRGNAFGQAQTDVKAVGYGSGQAQCDVKAQGYGSGQAQCNVKRTQNGFGQAQCTIRGNAFGQAQCDVKTVGYGSGQAQCDVKAVGYGFGQAQCDVKVTQYGFGQAQCDVKVTTSQCAQAQCDVKVTQYGFGQAQCDVKVTQYGSGQAQCDVKAIGYGSGQAQCDVKVTQYGLGQAQCDVKAIGYGSGQAQCDTKAIGYGSGQAQCTVRGNAFGQAQADIKQVGYGFGQAQAKLNAFNVNGSGQAQCTIRFTGTVGCGQAQAKINAFGQCQFGQANADIKTQGYGLGQAQADIKQTYSQVAQAQADIKQTYSQCAQAQADIKAQGYGLGQAQCTIRGNAFGQAQTDIKAVGYGSGQSQADIKSTGYGSGQAQCSILTARSSCGQAQADIKAQGYGLGQAQCDVKTQGYGLGQAQCDVRTKEYGSGQAQCSVNVVTQGSSQANADIKTQGFGLGQTQTDVKTQGNGSGQAQTDVKIKGYGLGQAQCYIQIINTACAQAQADIKKTYNQHGQVQADIKAVGTRCANAQALISTNVTSIGQAQADIKHTYTGSGQAKVTIQSGFNGFGQAQALIRIVDINNVAQAEALIIKSAGYGQTQAVVYQTHTLFHLDINDRATLGLVLNDRPYITLTVDDRAQESISISDRPIILTIGERQNISLTIDDREF